ncbi:endonuclease domain-containing protein [Nakamurella sp.]|uniref:endonuclease domain-containing protein n=1 Tax=Nakamurella sp. TaxID=1869182 RepID=UPI003782F2BE
MTRIPSELPPDLGKVAFTVDQGRRMGLTRRRMRANDLDRPFPGVRQAAAPAQPGAESLDQDGSADARRTAEARFRDRCVAVGLIVPPGAFFTHRTAARLWPLPLPALPTLPADEPIHIGVMLPEHPPRRSDVVGHAISDPLAFTVRRDDHLLIDPATLFCQLGAVLKVEDLVAVGDALVLAPRRATDSGDRPWLDLPTLRDRVERFRGRGKARADRALQLVRPGAESRPESLVRLAILAAGLPEPELNVDVYSSSGIFVGRADLLYRRYRLAIEYDGDHHRVDSVQFDRDIGRLDDFAAAGWRVVRIAKRSFFGDREACIGRVRRALIDAGWRPGPIPHPC